ncbi:MAG: hypothetical protein V1773_09690 [bacterium]
MKKYFFSTIIIVVLAFSSLCSQTRSFGIGFMAGDPTGLNGKYFLNPNNAVEVGLGVGVFGSENSFAIHVDYLYHNNTIIQSSENFPIFYGFGVRVRSKEEAEFGLGMRGVVGIAWVSQTMPIDIFLQIAPVFKLLPSAKFGIDGAVGARYYF